MSDYCLTLRFTFWRDKDQHAELDLYSASALKQESAGKHMAPLGHIILIPSQAVLDLTP